MSDELTIFRTALKTLLPKGFAWDYIEGGDFEKLIDGIGDALAPVLNRIRDLADTRNPYRTQILDDLEKEYGIRPTADSLPSDSDSEATATAKIDGRRNAVAGKAFATPKWGKDDLQARLDAAGFTDLTVYENEDPTDPNFYLSGEWSLVCDHENAYLGHDDSYCGQLGYGATLLANGPTHAPGSTTETTYPVSSDSDYWWLYFFVGGPIDEPSVGWVVFEDADMEETDVDAWTAGNDAVLTKQTSAAPEGSRNLRIAGVDNYVRQDVGVDIRDDNSLAALRMKDEGDNILYDVSNVGDDADNGLSYTNPTYTAGSNATDATAIEFDGETEGAVIDGALSVGASGTLAAWVKPSSGGRGSTFHLNPTTSGYAALSTNLEVEGAEVQPEFQVAGADADLTGWTTDFTLAGSSTDPTFDEIAPGIDESRVLFTGGNYYEATSASVGEIGTDDFYLEFIWKHVNESAVLVSKYVGASDNLEISTASGGNALRVSVNGSPWTAGSVNLTEGCWYRASVVGDRSGNVRVYINGVLAGSTSISSKSAENPGSTAKWTIGARTGGTSPSSASFSYIGLYTGTGIYTTDQIDTVESRRCAETFGVRANVGQWVTSTDAADLDAETVGTADWSGTDATLSKESDARTGGSGSLVLRITPDGVSTTALAEQSSIYTLGQEYRIRGWARADGTTVAVPQILSGDGSTVLWEGTASDTWQEVDETFTALGTDLSFVCSGSDLLTAWAEFDDFTITSDGTVPRTMERASEAVLEKWSSDDSEAYLIDVGENWIRLDERLDDQSAQANGIRIEPATENKILYNTGFYHVTWTKSEATINSDSETLLGDREFDAIIASVNNAHHYIEQQITQTAGTGHHTFTIYAKAGEVSGLRLEYTQGTNEYAYFNLSTGAVGDVGAGLDAAHPATMEYKGNGVYRCQMVYTAIGTSINFRISPSDGTTSGDETFTGDGTSDYVHIYGAQAEEDHHGAGSLLLTVASTVPRAEDDLVFWGRENITTNSADTGIARCRLLLDAPDPHETRHLWQIDDGAGNNLVTAYQNIDAETAQVNVEDGGSTQADITTTGELDHHAYCEFEVLWKIDDFRAWLSKLPDASTDTSGTVPAASDMEYLRVGSSDSAGRLSGLISALEFSSYGLANPRCFMGLNDASGEGAFVGYLPDQNDDTKIELFAGLDGEIAASGGSLAVDTWHHIGITWDGTDLNLYANGVELDSVADTTTMTGYDSMPLGWAALLGYDETDTGTAWYAPGAPCSLAAMRLRDTDSTAGWFSGMYASGVPIAEDGLVHELSSTFFEGGGASNYAFRDVIGGLEGEVPSMSETPEQFSTWAGVGIGATPTDSMTDFMADFGSSVEFMSNNDQSFMAWVKADVEDTDAVLWCNDINTLAPGETVVTSSYGGAVEDSPQQLITGGGDFVVTLDSKYVDGSWSAHGIPSVIAVANDGSGFVLQHAQDVWQVSPDGNTEYEISGGLGGRGNVLIKDGSDLYSVDSTREKAYTVRYTDENPEWEEDGFYLGTTDYANVYDGLLWAGTPTVITDGTSVNSGVYTRTGTSPNPWQLVVSRHDLSRVTTDGTDLYYVDRFANVYKWDGSTETSLGSFNTSFPAQGLVWVGGELYASAKTTIGSSEIFKWVSGTTWTAVTSGIGKTRDLVEYQGSPLAMDVDNDESVLVINDQAQPFQSLGIESNRWRYRTKTDYEERELSHTVTPGTWQHITVTRGYDAVEDETTMIFYIDGSMVTQNVFPGEPVLINQDLYMFANPDAGDPFYGSVVAPKFFNKALSSAEVTAQFNHQMTKILAGPYATQETIPTTDPVTLQWYQMADGAGSTNQPTWSAGYPFFFFQEEAGGLWKPLGEVADLTDDTWQYRSGVDVAQFNDFRLYTKNFFESGAFNSEFDDLYAGADSGEAFITPVSIDPSKKKTLEEIILRRKPLHSQCVLVVNYEEEP